MTPDWVSNHFPYWMLWGLTAFWLSAAYRVLSEAGIPAISSWAKRSWRPTIGILVLATVVFCVVTPDFRVLSDETNLFSVSLSMASEARVDIINEGYWRDGRFFPLYRVWDVRPYGFSFFVHWIHLLTGPRPANAFVLNFFLFVGALGFIYALCRRSMSAGWTWVCLLAVAAQPIILLCATSGGFDLFQLFWILASLTAFLFWFESPANEVRFRLLWMSLIVLSHARYESSLYFLTVVAVLLWTKKIPRGTLSKPIYWLSLLFFVPLIWQRLYLAANYHPPSLPTGTTLWSFESFLSNLVLFGKSLTVAPWYWPYNRILNILGIVAILWAFTRLLKRPWPLQPAWKTALLTFGLAATLQTAALTAYAESGLNLPQSARYFLLGSVTLSIAAVLGIYHLTKSRHGRVTAIVVGLLFLASLGIAGTNKHWDENRTTSEYRFVRAYLNSAGLDPRDTIIIARRPNIYVALGYGGLSYPNVRSERDPVEDVFSGSKDVRIFAVQENLEGMSPTETALPIGLQTISLAQKRHDSGKIWQVVEILRPANTAL